MALKEIDRLARLDLYLREAQTGDSFLLSKKVGISRSSLFNLFNELKVLGAQIEYDKIMQTYYYINDFEIEINIKKEKQAINFTRLKNKNLFE